MQYDSLKGPSPRMFLSLALRLCCFRRLFGETDRRKCATAAGLFGAQICIHTRGLHSTANSTQLPPKNDAINHSPVTRDLLELATTNSLSCCHSPSGYQSDSITVEEPTVKEKACYRRKERGALKEEKKFEASRCTLEHHDRQQG